MGIAIKEGRALTDADRADAPKVAVVGETLARTFWPGESAVAHYLLYEWNEQERRANRRCGGGRRAARVDPVTVLRGD